MRLVAEEHGRPAEALGFGDIAGRGNESGEPLEGHRLGFEAEIGQHHAAFRPFPILGYFRRIGSHETAPAGHADDPMRRPAPNDRRGKSRRCRTSHCGAG